MKKMKLLIASICLLVLSLSACKNGQMQDNNKDSSYTMEEKLEIARLAAMEELGFETVNEFKEGKAIVYFSDSVGFINLQGKITVVPGAKDLQNFSCGYAAGTTREDIPCFVDSTGRIIKTFPEYQAVYSFELDGITNFFHKNGKFGLIDKEFKELIPAKYNQTSFYSNGIYIVETGGKWGAVDTHDKTLIPFEYQSLGMMDEAGMIMATNANGSGYIDKTGKIMIPLHFYNLFPFQENFAKFMDKTSGNYGVIDRKGKIIVEPKYSDLQFYKNGICAAANYTYQKDAETIIKRGFIDSTGKEIIPLVYINASDFDKRGFALVSDSVETYFIDKTGKRVTPKTDLPVVKMEGFNQGFAKLELVDGSKWFLDGFMRVLKKEDLISMRNEFFK